MVTFWNADKKKMSKKCKQYNMANHPTSVDDLGRSVDDQTPIIHTSTLKIQPGKCVPRIHLAISPVGFDRPWPTMAAQNHGWPMIGSSNVATSRRPSHGSVYNVPRSRKLTQRTREPWLTFPRGCSHPLGPPMARESHGHWP